MLYNLMAFVQCCRNDVKVSAEETLTDTDFPDVEINDTKITFENKVSPTYTDTKICPPPYETPTVPQQTADSLAQAGIPYTATNRPSPYPQPRPPSIYARHQAATGTFSWAEERPYPNHYPPPYETPFVPQQTVDGYYTQAGIPYSAASPYYRQPRAATRPYHGHGRSRSHASLTDTGVPPVYLMPVTSDGRVVLVRPPYYG